MGRKKDADSIPSRVRSAANQIKILDQKGVIDLPSIQLWFGMLIGSFSLLYVFWNVFIVETNPRSHFPEHLQMTNTDNSVLHQAVSLGGARLHLSFVSCEVEDIDGLIATIKNVVILSISPIHLILFTQDTVMNILIKEIEHLSWDLPGRITFQFEFAKGYFYTNLGSVLVYPFDAFYNRDKDKLYSDDEAYPCAQQKILIPADLHSLPAVIVASQHFLLTSNTDLLWDELVTGLEGRQAFSGFLDNDTEPSDNLFGYHLTKIRKFDNDYQTTLLAV